MSSVIEDKCIKKGVPNLISLSKKLDVPFTFFINMGRGTSRWSFIKKIIPFGSKSIPHTTLKLSNLKKLVNSFHKTPGFIDFFRLFTSKYNNTEHFS